MYINEWIRHWYVCIPQKKDLSHPKSDIHTSRKVSSMIWHRIECRSILCFGINDLSNIWSGSKLIVGSAQPVSSHLGNCRHHLTYAGVTFRNCICCPVLFAYALLSAQRSPYKGQDITLINTHVYIYCICHYVLWGEGKRLPFLLPRNWNKLLLTLYIFSSPKLRSQSIPHASLLQPGWVFKTRIWIFVGF